MDLEKQILSCRNLTPAEQRIGRFILENPAEIITMTGKEMELRLFVSKSAIYRFCKKIGVEGFNELKLEIASSSRSPQDEENIGFVSANLPFQAEDSPEKIFRQLAHLYEQTISDLMDTLPEQDIEKAVSICSAHKPIYLFAHQHNYSMASLFRDKMLEIGYEVIVAVNDELAVNLARILPTDSCAIVVSYTGTTDYVSDILDVFKDRKIPSILISRSEDEHLLHKTDVRLKLPGKEMWHERVGQFASDLEVHFILDVLYGTMLNSDRTRAFYFMSHRFCHGPGNPKKPNIHWQKKFEDMGIDEDESSVSKKDS